jgi:glycosyltransferase involved in cell wall biosynthesis
MLISIITATRNAGQSIAATLRSVAEQKGADIEHIVVDGASTDDTVDIVKRQGLHVARLISEPDDGLYDAFNKGLSVATGEVIGFLNAGDTYLSSGSVATLCSAFANELTDVAFGDLWIVDRVDHSRVIRRVRSRHFLPRLLPYGFMPAHPTMFMRRRMYERLGGYRTNYLIAGDFELCVRAFLIHDCSYQYVPHALVRMPRGGISNQGWRSSLTITREMRRACLVNGVYTNYIKLAMRIPRKLSELFGARQVI